MSSPGHCPGGLVDAALHSGKAPSSGSFTGTSANQPSFPEEAVSLRKATQLKKQHLCSVVAFPEPTRMWPEELGRAKGLDRAQEESGPKTFRMEGALVVTQPIFCQCKPVPQPHTCSSSLLRLPKAVPRWCEHTHGRGFSVPGGKGPDADGPQVPHLSSAVSLSNITSPWGISWAQGTSLDLTPWGSRWAQVGPVLVWKGSAWRHRT